MRLPVATGWGAGPFSGPTCPRSLSIAIALPLSIALQPWSVHSVRPSIALKARVGAVQGHTNALVMASNAAVCPQVPTFSPTHHALAALAMVGNGLE